MEIPEWMRSALVVASEFLPTPLRVGTSVVLDSWASANLEKFMGKVEYRFRMLEQSRISRADLEGDHFKAAVIRVAREAAETTGDIKRQALANALVSYVATPTASWDNKELLLRSLIQLTELEIAILTQFDRYDQFWVFGQNVAEEVGRPASEIRVVCEGLQQLGMLQEGSRSPDSDDSLASTGFPLKSDWRSWGDTNSWHVTMLAQNLIQFVTASEVHGATGNA